VWTLRYLRLHNQSIRLIGNLEGVDGDWRRVGVGLGVGWSKVLGNGTSLEANYVYRRMHIL
jgi:hypothetical protein